MHMSRAFAVAMAVAFLAPHAGAQDARGTLRRSLPVATRDLARGDTLRDTDITMHDTTILWRWNNAPDSLRVTAGWVTRRSVMKGELLREPAVMAPPVVTSGQSVSVIYQDGPVRLLLAGVATNTAPLGAPVGVRIGRTRRLDGIAVAPNTVRLR